MHTTVGPAEDCKLTGEAACRGGLHAVATL